MLMHGLYDAAQLTVAAIQIRRENLKTIMDAQTPTFTSVDAIMLGVTAVLIVFAVMLIRQGLRGAPVVATPASPHASHAIGT